MASRSFISVAILALAQVTLITCSSKADFGRFEVKQILKNPCGDLNAVYVRLGDRSFQGVFLIKDTSEATWKDMIFQVKGVIKEVSWTKCNSLKIKSDGLWREFNKEQYVNGKEKYEGITVDLIHHQW